MLVDAVAPKKISPEGYVSHNRSMHTLCTLGAASIFIQETLSREMALGGGSHLTGCL